MGGVPADSDAGTPHYECRAGLQVGRSKKALKRNITEREVKNLARQNQVAVGWRRMLLGRFS